MQTKMKIFTICASILAGAALAATPAPLKADPPDAGFLPQCPDGTMFRLLMMRCVPYDKQNPDGNNHIHEMWSHSKPKPV